MRRKRKTSPVVYIDQPDFRTPHASMQNEYNSLLDRPEEKVTTKKQKTVRSPQARWNQSMIFKNEVNDAEVFDAVEVADKHIEEDVEEKGLVEPTNRKKEIEGEGHNTPDLETEIEESKRISETEISNETPDFSPSFEKKPFKEMTIIEQIDYLVTPSKFTPKLKCEVKTNDERFRGKIIEKKEDHIKFETFKQPKYHQIKIEEIKNIRLLGF